MRAVIVNEVRQGFYLDSVALMRVSRTIANLNGIDKAALMMGTPANRKIMKDAGLLDGVGASAAGGDLVIGIRAKDLKTAEQALLQSQAMLDQPAADAGSVSWRPKTLRSAFKSAPDANFALISVPGEFAVAEARKAISQGLHTMIFSDNIDLAEEASLKQEAREVGRLVMGPDCGTAIINGVPLAFANRVPRGEIGIIGASGTGTQEVCCLIAQYGSGISHAIGVGGRDLKSEVGGISTLMALDAMGSDTSTSHIVLISKPPPADVAARVLDRIAKMDKPATVCFIGADELPMPANAKQVFSLKNAAQTACGMGNEFMNAKVPEIIDTVPARRKQIRGLFSGGTLCAEAQIIFRAAEEAVISNTPIPGVLSLGVAKSGHTLLDLGDDKYTQGNPHPMIDPSVRDDAIIEALKDDSVAVILAYVVIGYGAHYDPAGHLARTITTHQPTYGPLVITSVTGTDGDPQVRSVQMSKLEAVGILVAPTNADAASWALSAIRSKA